MLRRVNRNMEWRLLRRVIPRRWKRYAGILLISGMCLRPDLAAQTVSWVWEERAQRMVSVMTDTFAPETPPGL